MKIATVISDGLNVRVKPHEKADIVFYLAKGDKRQILGHDESVPGFLWLRVKEGWIYSKYVSVSSSVPDEEPPEIPLPPELEDSVWFFVKMVGAAVALGLFAWWLA